MADAALLNADIDAALSEAKETYVARNPKSFARFIEATAVMPGGQHPHGAALHDPFPGCDGEGRCRHLVDGGRRRLTSISSAKTPPGCMAIRIR